ncbi:MAG: hypothetical protein A2161_11170 [Candidatus Schekmanbacteria bacterium RBG_13_48_7]|uniref:Glycosyl transferase family 1 domain-containing protein n=1 Tax=Candidatus Schekmanbacteria bacterium RBG_13_48_7 TaxID=1817878 RepID=A0A1F7S4X5_9BACT|nr:MAG: hypothetical protein A2161_11170 [Candidatus Schekmanbacteria bacterium RBG_13_48_7]
MDIIINIRYPSTGETSGSLIKAMGLGKPLIISDLEQYREIAEDACLRVDIDDESGKMLEEAIRKLVKDGNLRSQIGYNAEKHIDQFHKINNSAGKIANFVKLHGISHASSEPYDVSFLYKVEQLGFLDHLAKEITQISEGPASGNLVELISEVVADFEG